MQRHGGSVKLGKVVVGRVEELEEGGWLIASPGGEKRLAPGPPQKH